MRFLYTLGIYLYGFALKLAAPFVPKAKLWVQGRKNQFNAFPVPNSEVYWFHCASLGEFDQGLPLMRALKAKNPDILLLVTFFSPSGYLHYHKRDHPANFVCYLPLDTPSNARKFISHFKPKKCFFVKYEFWANFILEAKKHKSAIYLVSGIFRADHRFFKWYGAFFRRILKQFDHLFIQNEKSAVLLNSIGIGSYTISGDNRYDTLIEKKNTAQRNSAIEAFLAGEKAFIMGSSWPEGEAIIFPEIQKADFPMKTIIAPHDLSEAHLTQIQNTLGQNAIRFTQIPATPDPATFRFLILDTIGHLTDAYQYAAIAYIGGGFSGKLHNILEPGVYNIPVLFGPKHSRFPEAEQFLEASIAKEIANSAEFNRFFRELCRESNLIADKSKIFIAHHAGATERVMAHLNLVDH